MEIEQEFVEFFMNLIKISKDSESLKQIINDNENFEPYAVFTRIDRFQKNSIDMDDIVNFLRDNNHFILRKDYKEIKLFLENYDRDCDSCMNLEEFLNFILNKTNTNLRATSTQRKTFKIAHNEFLPTRLEGLITELFISELKLFNYADKKKLTIHLNKIDYLKLFILLDNNKDGFISEDDISEYLRSEHEIVLFKDEIRSLINIYDHDYDNNLNWDEFLMMILPSKSSYEYDYCLLRDMEIVYRNTFYNSIRQEKLKYYTRNDMNIDFKSYAEYDNIKEINKSLDSTRNNDELNVLNNLAVQNQFSKSQSDSLPESGNIIIKKNKFPKTNNTFKLFAYDIYTLLQFYIKHERIKIKLANDQNFNLIHIFKLFDRHDLNVVRFSDFIKSLEYFNVINLNNLNQINKSELLFGYYDKQNNKKLK
jgi:Ca2+-binding EF-hand superfamily protein